MIFSLPPCQHQHFHLKRRRLFKPGGRHFLVLWFSRDSDPRSGSIHKHALLDVSSLPLEKRCCIPGCTQRVCRRENLGGWSRSERERERWGVRAITPGRRSGAAEHFPAGLVRGELKHFLLTHPAPSLRPHRPARAREKIFVPAEVHTRRRARGVLN